MADFGLVGDTYVGIVGAMIGEWLLPRFNFHFMEASAVDATIGAILLSVVLRSVGASGWDAGR